MNHMKTSFIGVINDVKGKLRPHLGINDVKMEEDESKTQPITRPLYRIKSMEKVVENSRESGGFERLFN